MVSVLVGTRVVHFMKEYRATVRDHGKFAERFLPAVAFVGLGSFIQGEDARSELRTFRGELVRDKLPGAPSEVVAEDLGAVYNGDSEDGDWALADFESRIGDTVAGSRREIRESLLRIQQA